MSLFSQRKGITPLAKAIQRESIDDELKNCLWSALELTIYNKWERRDSMSGYQHHDARFVDFLLQRYWLDFFKLPNDTIPDFGRDRPKSGYEHLRDYFMNGEWWEAYDFLEFTIKSIHQHWAKDLKKLLNSYLERENAAYRIVGNEVIEITDENEISEIESALAKNTKTISLHLQRSLELISDKQSPDYRNSIKEAISAVEAACRMVSGDEKATLGAALKKIDSAQSIHPAFREALSKLYGYTSDGEGIRHSLTENTNAPSYADSKFMLVASSAFVNFLWTKSAENGIKIH